MFYRPGLNPHGLAHNPFKALVAPAPDRLDRHATTPTGGSQSRALQLLQRHRRRAADGDVRQQRPQGRAIDEGKDTVANIRATGEFVVNVVSFALRAAMNESSEPLPRPAKTNSPPPA